MPSAGKLDPPLADYFWIAGIDSMSYGEYIPQDPRPTERRSFSDQLLEAIDAHEEEEDAQDSNFLSTTDVNGSSQRRSSNGQSSTNGTASPKNRLSNGSSNSSGDPSQQISRSNTPSDLVRHSSTSSNSTITESRSINERRKKKKDFDFDKALLKFAAERDTFLEDLSFSAGTIVQNKPLMHPKAQKVVSEDFPSRLEKTTSIRRRISLRELTSMRRSPSVVNRAASIRTAKRMSNYNSVIPTPQPLNPNPNMHPLKRKFEPVLLDRYPPKHLTEEANRRGAFPDYVPMFAFPNDVNIVSADERPRSTWHGFTMTSGDSAQLHGVCVIVWVPLNQQAAENIERQCDIWRRDNMSDEERELAASLGERLAAERTKLSRLLMQLHEVSKTPALRDELDDEISQTEERIALMADLLRPVRHGAAAKIEGLTDGETGLWLPRAYGILGKDKSMTSFWKEWLKAIVVPMLDGAIERVPPASPRVGIWAPLERYVVNLCAEAPSPISSKTQVEIGVRELRLYARREAQNELPDSRTTDLYPLFRCLSLPNIVTLFEFALAESRIILLSSHTSMLHLVSRALISLLYPMQWLGVYVPVLPARLLSAMEAPCPYIVGIERRYEKIELPEEDFVCVDLDADVIISSSPPHPLPRQQRRKLLSLLQAAAPLHNKYGVPVGPPQYAIETFPNDTFMSEHTAVFSPNTPMGSLAKLVTLSSTSFGEAGTGGVAPRTPIFNAFLQSKAEPSKYDRPGTGGTMRGGSPPSPTSPNSHMYPTGSGPSRQDSGFTLTATLRGKRSGNFDNISRRSSSFAFERAPTLRRPSLPFTQHSSSASITSMGSSSNSNDSHSIYNAAYPPSVFAPSTIAASTIMPSMLMEPVRNSETTQWVEGHCMNWCPQEDSACSICTFPGSDGDGLYVCQSCPVRAHRHCMHQIILPCAAAFFPDQIRAAFVRCFASLLYTYRKYLGSPSVDGKKAGKLYRFNMEGFLKSMPQENSSYIQMLEQTQMFSEFIHDRESKPATDPSVKFFDEIIQGKKNRGKTGFFSRSKPSFLQDTTEHIWRTSSAISTSYRPSGDGRVFSNRIPAKLDPVLMREPRVNQGAPIMKGNPKRKPINTGGVPEVRINGQ